MPARPVEVRYAWEVADERLAIPARFRAGLLLKGLLLVSLGGLFVALLLVALAGGAHPAIKAVALVLFGVPAAFLLSVSRHAFLDAVVGEAVRITAAEALPSRSAGYSLRLPTGRFAEYLLYNPWERLTPGRRYTVVVGRRSLVLVEPPVAEGQVG